MPTILERGVVDMAGRGDWIVPAFYAGCALWVGLLVVCWLATARSGGV